MKEHELVVVLINLSMLIFAYLWFYPKIAGSDGKKVALYDLLVSITSLIVVGVIFWGSQLEFNIIFTTVNWFFFSLIIYLIIEFPLMLWYFKKYNIWNSYK